MTDLLHRLPALALSVALTTCAFPQDHERTIRSWLEEQGPHLGLTERDAHEWTVTSAHTDGKGATFVYIRQQAHGRPVHGAEANFALRSGRVVHFGDRLQRDAAGRSKATGPTLTAIAALEAGARQLGLAPTGIRIEQRRSAEEMTLSPSGIALAPIAAALIHQVDSTGGIVLCWDLTIRSTDTDHWWHVAVDASTGAIVRLNDYVAHCDHGSDRASRGYDAADELALPASNIAGGGGSGYRVFPFPTESPLHGTHVLVTDPADPVASPFGWHDVDGVPGPEYTITRGNNVYAGEDLDDDDILGHSTDGGPALLFDHPYTPPQFPQEHLDASITNLFYTCNVLHDVWYRYGFDHASGNFQAVGHGDGPGMGMDEVIAQAQDGGGMNNANFATPPDGESGRMQMYIWRTSSDSTLRIESPAGIAGFYVNALAGFGPALPTTPLTADLVLVEDELIPTSDGCDQLLNGSALEGRIALVDRGQCNFVDKVWGLQLAGAVAVIVVNNVVGVPFAMGDGGGGGDGITIPAVMVTQDDGQLFKQALLDGPVEATLMAASMENLRDPDFDNGIIAHEYGHGVSNRLTGGAANTDCLWNDEQMGEGWSDWMGLVLTMRPNDGATTARGIGNFVKDEPVDGPGIRPAPYSTDISVNAFTYDDTNDPGLTQPHGVGFVWATMLWDMTWALIEEHGLDPDVYGGTGGNNLAMQLVMDGLKLQPCSPGFVDGRNAILVADTLLTGGANSCLIWKAFADRGLGFSADQGSPDSRFDQSEAFDLPTACTMSIGGVDNEASLEQLRVHPNPASDQLVLDMPARLRGSVTIRLLTADGRIARSWPPSIGGGTQRLAIGDLAPAIYVLEVVSAGERRTDRIAVAR